MNNLLSQANAGDARAVVETNLQRLDVSLAFGITPSLELSGLPTAVLGAPAAGTFVLGQFWVDAKLAIWRCTVAGTPGTWVQQTPAVVTANPAGAPAEYLIKRADLHWAEFYW